MFLTDAEPVSISGGNVSVEAGDSVTFNCRSNNMMNRWAFQKTDSGSFDLEFIYNGQKFTERIDTKRYQVLPDDFTGNVSLIIVSVKPEDAGQYQCIDGNNEWKHVFNLIVTGYSRLYLHACVCLSVCLFVPMQPY